MVATCFGAGEATEETERDGARLCSSSRILCSNERTRCCQMCGWSTPPENRTNGTITAVDSATNPYGHGASHHHGAQAQS